MGTGTINLPEGILNDLSMDIITVSGFGYKVS